MFDKIREIKKGLSNFWKYRKVIYNDRWYDYNFLHNILKVKLIDMRDNWDKSHYVGHNNELELLKDLVQILEDIEHLEYEWDTESDKKIDELYAEFGDKLFTIKTVTIISEEFSNGEHTTTTSNFRRLWD